MDVAQIRKLRQETESQLANIIQTHIDSFQEQTGLAVSSLELNFLEHRGGEKRLVLIGLNFKVLI